MLNTRAERWAMLTVSSWLMAEAVGGAGQGVRHTLQAFVAFHVAVVVVVALEVFNERMSILFKKLRIVRMVDVKRHTLVYLRYSDRVIEGSPQNSVTAVPVDRAIAIPVK